MLAPCSLILPPRSNGLRPNASLLVNTRELPAPLGDRASATQLSSRRSGGATTGRSNAGASSTSTTFSCAARPSSRTTQNSPLQHGGGSVTSSWTSTRT